MMAAAARVRRRAGVTGQREGYTRNPLSYTRKEQPLSRVPKTSPRRPVCHGCQPSVDLWGKWRYTALGSNKRGKGVPVVLGTKGRGIIIPRVAACGGAHCSSVLHTELSSGWRKKAHRRHKTHVWYEPASSLTFVCSCMARSRTEAFLVGRDKNLTTMPSNCHFLVPLPSF